MRRSACASMALMLCLAAVAGEAPRKKPLKAHDDEAVANAKVAAALKAKKVSFDFVDTPLQDALAFMRGIIGVNVIIDPAVGVKQPVTIRVNDMQAGRALQWLAKVGGGEMKVQNGAVYIAAGNKGRAVLKTGKGGVRVEVQPKVHGVYPLVLPGGNVRRFGRMIGKAQIHLGDVADVELNLYEGDLDAGIRKLVLSLLRRQLVRELKEFAGDEEEEDDRERREKAEAQRELKLRKKAEKEELKQRKELQERQEQGKKPGQF